MDYRQSQTEVIIVSASLQSARGLQELGHHSFHSPTLRPNCQSDVSNGLDGPCRFDEAPASRTEQLGGLGDLRYSSRDRLVPADAIRAHFLTTFSRISFKDLPSTTRVNRVLIVCKLANFWKKPPKVLVLGSPPECLDRFPHLFL